MMATGQGLALGRLSLASAVCSSWSKWLSKSVNRMLRKEQLKENGLLCEKVKYKNENIMIGC